MSKQLAQIQKQIAKLEQQARALKKKEAQGVIANIKEAIAFYELTSADLGFGGGAARKARTSSAPAAKKGGRKASAGRVKYRDEHGNTWTGHGRRPQWFIDALAAGTSPEQMAA